MDGLVIVRRGLGAGVEAHLPSLYFQAVITTGARLLGPLWYRCVVRSAYLQLVCAGCERRGVLCTCTCPLQASQHNRVCIVVPNLIPVDPITAPKTRDFRHRIGAPHRSSWRESGVSLARWWQNLNLLSLSSFGQCQGCFEAGNWVYGCVLVGKLVGWG